MRKSILLFIILLILILIGIFIYGKNSVVSINGKVISAEIADSDAERASGLMYREKLGGNSGMLFMFPYSEIQSFWMKNTLIPLDIIFIDENFEIVDIVRDARPCTADLCAVYSSNFPVKYALEVNSGYADRTNLTLGEKVNVTL